jgi:hypothetical protein
VTARELYKVDPEFRLLISHWVSHYTPPLSLPDYCIEAGLPLVAEGVEWAVQMEWRPLWLGRRLEQKGTVYPGRLDLKDNIKRWFWTFGNKIHRFTDADAIPHQTADEVLFINDFPAPYRHFTTPEPAILAFCDGWAKALEKGADLPRFLQVGTE